MWVITPLRIEIGLLFLLTTKTKQKEVATSGDYWETRRFKDISLSSNQNNRSHGQTIGHHQAPEKKGRSRKQETF